MRHGFVVDEQLDVAELLVGGRIRTGAGVDEIAAIDAPVIGKVGTLLLEIGFFLFAFEFDAGVRIPAIPAAQVLAIEEGAEACGRRVVFCVEGRGGERCDD